MSESLGAMTFVAMIFSLYMMFVYVPPEGAMGPAQRTMCFLVPLACIAFLALGIVCVASIACLIRANHTVNGLAASSAEIGLLFTSLVLITGPLWAKQAWNTWWTWDVLLTTTVLLWLVYAAYLILRFLSGRRVSGFRAMNVFGAIGPIVIPAAYAAYPRGKMIHWALFSIQGTGSLLFVPAALTVSLITFILFFFYLLLLRLSIFTVQAELSILKEHFTTPVTGG